MALGKVLIVEDDEVVQFLVARLNSKMGFAEQVIFANNGKKALEAMENGAFSLVLLDVNMPIMDGFEFLDALTQLRLIEGISIPPIFLFTSSENPKDKERAAHYPIVKGYLTKPFSKAHVEYLMGLSLEGTELEAV